MPGVAPRRRPCPVAGPGRSVEDFGQPNFFFHLTTAYALLRAQGVPIGKRDFFGGM